jgi:hypothetical protein
MPWSATRISLAGTLSLCPSHFYCLNGYSTILCQNYSESCRRQQKWWDDCLMSNHSNVCKNSPQKEQINKYSMLLSGDCFWLGGHGYNLTGITCKFAIFSRRKVVNLSFFPRPNLPAISSVQTYNFRGKISEDAAFCALIEITWWVLFLRNRVKLLSLNIN